MQINRLLFILQPVLNLNFIIEKYLIKKYRKLFFNSFSLNVIVVFPERIRRFSLLGLIYAVKLHGFMDFSVF
jgi:hypothetical protein